MTNCIFDRLTAVRCLDDPYWLLGFLFLEKHMGKRNGDESSESSKFLMTNLMISNLMPMVAWVVECMWLLALSLNEATYYSTTISPNNFLIKRRIFIFGLAFNKINIKKQNNLSLNRISILIWEMTMGIFRGKYYTINIFKINILEIVNIK